MNENNRNSLNDKENEIEDTDIIQKIIDMDPAIKKVHERIKCVEQDENMLHAYRMHEMAIYDFNTSVSVAKKEGREEGKKEEQIKTIKRLRDRNFSIKDIAETMDITEQEVCNLLDR